MITTTSTATTTSRGATSTSMPLLMSHGVNGSGQQRQQRQQRWHAFVAISRWGWLCRPRRHAFAAAATNPANTTTTEVVHTPSSASPERGGLATHLAMPSQHCRQRRLHFRHQRLHSSFAKPKMMADGDANSGGDV